MRRNCAVAIIAIAISAFTAFADGVPYVQNGSPEQVLDFYWTARNPAATVLFIHGGSLQESGERRTSEAYRDVCKPFLKANIACATMDYRLAPTSQWPAMPNDVAAAVLEVRKQIVKRGGDPARLFLFGHSSGCQLAAIVGTNPTYLATVGLKTSDLAGIIPMGCTLDRNDAALRGLTADAIRTPFAKSDEKSTYGTPENWIAANPASFIGPHVPPTLVVVAHNERFFPSILEQGARFVRQLLEANVVADLVIVPGRHMSSIADITTPGDPTFAAIKAFIEH